ncbi:MAG TPA: hypothetical protein VLA26_10620 [Gammaproteobacteria bacterium]|nr:hypothetical protein [Gammaproteobacteria bacterium]
MIAVGRLKLREADDLLEQARADFTTEELQDMLAIRERLGAYQARLRLGVGHQSSGGTVIRPWTVNCCA